MEVYRRSLKVVKQIRESVSPSATGYGSLVSQLRRAATSISLNIAEGYGRYNAGDKRRFYLIARGSCYECATAVELCLDAGLIDEASYSLLSRDLDEISRMLTGLARRWDQRGKEF
jgi:four helix bundle protein